jgi:D-alanyl-lipoteichoic acid acyltransferase DltB (MBOAT superfamily)
LYIPLGGSRGGLTKTIRNTFIIFLVSGFWHGANWTFVIWGAVNALLITPSVIMHTNRSTLDTVAMERKLPSLKEAGQLLLTFTLTTFAWIIFRAENIGQAYHYIAHIFSYSFFSVPEYTSRSLIFIILITLTIEWINRCRNFGIEAIGLSWRRSARWGLYIAIVFLIVANIPEVSQQFIYFQF